MKALAACLVLAGCGASNLTPPTSDANNGCMVVIEFNPAMPVADPAMMINASAQLTNAPGVPGYVWTVQKGGVDVLFNSAQLDNSAIEFIAIDPGVYNVGLHITGIAADCPSQNVPLNVKAPGAMIENVRLRVTPPHSVLTPPFEITKEVLGGANASVGDVVLDPGLTAQGTATTPSGGPLQAYLRFSPGGAPDAVVEAYTDATGNYATRVLGQPHTVLVIPTATTAVAPTLLPNWTAGNPITAVTGTVVTGTVRDLANAPLANATVQLTVDGVVPSTIATTASDGSFSLRVAPGGMTTVEVTPPDASGLPRLSATAAFSVGQPIAIRYSGFTQKNLAGVRIRRGGGNLANAKLVVVGSLVAGAGTITAGVAASATGTVRLAASADATGALPSMLVPSAMLSAVISPTPGDLAVAVLDTTGTPPATLDAPAMPSVATVAKGKDLDSGMVVFLPDAILDIVPAGALALAGTPAIHLVADMNGAFATHLAAGGQYDLRFRDPDPRRRAAPLAITNRTAGNIVASYQLPPGLILDGTVEVSGSSTPVAGAAVQILCTNCTGIVRQKPIAEVASTGTGTFAVAVPDPGTM